MNQFKKALDVFAKGGSEPGSEPVPLASNGQLLHLSEGESVSPNSHREFPSYWGEVEHMEAHKIHNKLNERHKYLAGQTNSPAVRNKHMILSEHHGVVADVHRIEADHAFDRQDKGSDHVSKFYTHKRAKNI